MDLNDVLSDKPIPAPVETAEPATEAAATSDDKSQAPVTPEPVAAPSAASEPETEPKARDEQGRFAKTVPIEALHAERTKRQQLEAQLAAQAQPQPIPSVFENEDAAISSRVSAAIAPLQGKLLNMSIAAAKAVPGREDYDEVAQVVFAEAAAADPRLRQAFIESEHPGEFAYTQGKLIKELSAHGGDVLKYGEAKRNEGAAETATLKQQIAALQAEINTLKASKAKQAQVPQSLNSEPSAAGNDQQFAGPTPLKSILN